MIAFNFLPHRALARQQQRERFRRKLGLAAGLGLLLALLGLVGLQRQISVQQEKNQLLEADIAGFDAGIKALAVLQAEVGLLQAREQALQALQLERRLALQLFTELPRHLPEGLVISSLRQDGKTLNLSGFALSNDRVSEFLRQLAQGYDWFSGPELVEVVAANLELPGRAPSRGASFTIRLRLEPAPPGIGAEPKAGALPAPLRKTLEPGA
jgi:type IV pilus assembly protein PilN